MLRPAVSARGAPASPSAVSLRVSPMVPELPAAELLLEPERRLLLLLLPSAGGAADSPSLERLGSGGIAPPPLGFLGME
jgi:hypothetical protein